MDNKIDIEKILIEEQIKYIQKEVENIKEFYCGKYVDSYGREYDIDYPYLCIQEKYKQLIEDEETIEGKLNYYKKMYQECVDLVFNEIDSQPEPVLFETDMCGGDSRLIIFEEEQPNNSTAIETNNELKINNVVETNNQAEIEDKEESYDGSDFYSKLRYISRKYASSMSSFLNNVLSEEVYLLCLTKILLNEDNDLFDKFTRELNEDNFSREEFLFWLAFKDECDNVSNKWCRMVMEENLQRLKEEGREEEITALLDGDETVFYRIKGEDMRLREDNTADYNWFICNYIDTFYALRYNMKNAGVTFPKDEEDD